MPETEIDTADETRDLMRVLAFKLVHLHSDHYYKIAQRADVVHHRGLYAPLYHSLLNSEKVWVLNGDASFFHENDRSDIVWLPMDISFSDLQDFGTGTGKRLNAFEWVAEEGLLRHPDGSTPYFRLFGLINSIIGASAGTIYPFGDDSRCRFDLRGGRASH